MDLQLNGLANQTAQDGTGSQDDTQALFTSASNTVCIQIVPSYLAVFHLSLIMYSDLPVTKSLISM